MKDVPSVEVGPIEVGMQAIHSIVRTLSAPRPRDITPDELRQELSDCSAKGVCSPVVQSLFEDISISTLHAAILNKELDPRQLLLAAKAISAKARRWNGWRTIAMHDEYTWEILLSGILPFLNRHPQYEWSLGGGTALYITLSHRLSKDIDLFFTNANVLRDFAPSRNPALRDFCDSFQQPGHFIKLEVRDVGEIDFL